MSKLLGIPVVNGGVIAASMVHSIDEVLRVVLITVTILFTGFQLIRMWWRWKREDALVTWIIQAQAKCGKARAGDCPLESKVKELQK